MSVELDLKKDGIRVVSKIDTLTVNSIAKNIADRLVYVFPYFNLNAKNIFIKLSRLNMYKASMPNGIAEANYFYKNSSIYFNEHIQDEDLEEFAIHECIHYLQEVKDSQGYLIRMGLCDYTGFKIKGMGLNEAAVQLMTSKIIGVLPDYEKYFGITLYTPSPSYYPLECALIKQMTYLIGEDILFSSTLNSTDDFKNTFIKATSKDVFLSIQDAFDDILKFEENIISLQNKLILFDEKNDKSKKIEDKIEKYKSKISITFMRTQNLILSSYFDCNLKKIENMEQLENYRRKLFGFKDLIGIMDGYTFFDNYYIEAMSKLEHKCNILENGGIETALSKKSNSFIFKIFPGLKKLFNSNASEKIKN